MFERIGTSYFFKDKFLYRSVWRNVKLQEVKNSRGQKYQHHKTKATKRMNIILFDTVRWVANNGTGKKKLQVATKENLT